MKLRALYISCRPKQWIKNLLVFAAPIFSLNINSRVFFLSIFSLICFCLISSSIYLLNDSLDINEDKKHPIKKYRPIASGLISVKIAIFSAIFFTSLSLIISLIISKILFIILVSYIVIQISYCLKFKNKPLLDLICISSGFLLRASAGGVASDIYLSPWFLLSVGFLALFLAVEKRKAELIQFQENGKLTRKVLKKYSFPLLLRIESLCSSGTLLTYSLWAAGPALQGASTKGMLFTVPFVLFGILRYQFLSDPDVVSINKEKDMKFTSQNPEEILVKDKGIQITIFYGY